MLVKLPNHSWVKPDAVERITIDTADRVVVVGVADGEVCFKYDTLSHAEELAALCATTINAACKVPHADL